MATLCSVLFLWLAFTTAKCLDFRWSYSSFGWPRGRGWIMVKYSSDEDLRASWHVTVNRGQGTEFDMPVEVLDSGFDVKNRQVVEDDVYFGKALLRWDNDLPSYVTGPLFITLETHSGMAHLSQLAGNLQPSAHPDEHFVEGAEVLDIFPDSVEYIIGQDIVANFNMRLPERAHLYGSKFVISLACSMKRFRSAISDLDDVPHQAALNNIVEYEIFSQLHQVNSYPGVEVLVTNTSVDGKVNLNVSLYIDNASEDHNGVYECLVTSQNTDDGAISVLAKSAVMVIPVGATSYLDTGTRMVTMETKADLLHHFPPSVENEAVMRLHEPNAITCYALSNPYSFQVFLLKDGVPIPDEGYLVHYGGQGRGHVVTYYLASATESDAGNYTCISVNAQGCAVETLSVSVEQGDDLGGYDDIPQWQI